MASKKSNPFMKMAIDTAMFGVGMGLINDTASSLPSNSPAQNIVTATGTVYAAKYLERSLHGNKKAQDRSIWD